MKSKIATYFSCKKRNKNPSKCAAARKWDFDPSYSEHANFTSTLCATRFKVVLSRFLPRPGVRTDFTFASVSLETLAYVLRRYTLRGKNGHRGDGLFGFDGQSDTRGDASGGGQYLCVLSGSSSVRPTAFSCAELMSPPIL